MKRHHVASLNPILNLALADCLKTY